MPTENKYKGKWIAQMADGTEVEIYGLHNMTFDEAEQKISEYNYIRVVRCQECRFFDNRKNPKCELSGLNVNGDDYCSKGRAK